MTPGHLPPWPPRPVAYGPVVLRELTAADVAMARELSTDPYVPLIGTLPANASPRQAQDWVDRQRGRLAEGTGFSFAIAEAGTGRAVGGIGLWLASLAQGRATAGYSLIPSARGRGIAAAALTALTERAGYEREGLLRSHQEIGGRRRDMFLYAVTREAPRHASNMPTAERGLSRPAELRI